MSVLLKSWIKPSTTVVLLLLLVSRQGRSECDEDSWDYEEDGADWAEDSIGQCDGTMNSPINVIPSEVISELDTSYGIEQLTEITVTIDDDDDDDDTTMWELHNNGHTINLYPETNDKYRMNGGILPADEEYCLAQFHFHWGSSDTTGTEHQINGIIYPLDSHFVFFPCRFDSIGDALAHSGDQDGIGKYVLAVVNLIFELADDDDDDDDDDDVTDLSAITDALEDGYEYENRTDIMLAKELFGLVNTHSDYYSYLGGLTTPNCNEIVRWHVIKQRLRVSSDVTDTMRTNVEDCEGEPIEKNWRVVVENSNPLWSYCTDEDLVDDDEECTVDNTDNASGAVMNYLGFSGLILSLVLLVSMSILF